MAAKRFWWDLSMAEFAARDMSRTVALLPVGAVEQHGPHLPVKVDAAINAGVLGRALELMPETADLLVLPPMPVGKSNEHLSYPGTLSLSLETLLALWLDIAGSVARAGCRRIVLFNSHGGQIAPVDIACREIRLRFGMLAVAASWFRLASFDHLYDAHEMKHGIHGGDMETSVMLALHPDLVDMSKAEDFVPLSVTIEQKGDMLTPEGAVGFGWRSEDLHPAGVSGNAARADAKRGQETIDLAAHALVRLVAEMSAFDLRNFDATPRLE